ncbi:Hypothetical protein ZAZAV_595 [Cedratvirus Zaza IHUMI]|uniref:Uncharacterized protein n=1 Tax=Cedratvirus Zaza IHUMI TaxID=2126979 RepID=A0A2R8FG54_9VIRU|nr:Hypothetical protein ZAZAV_595 [Cedratvirus Zaza IHUMI]
MSSMFFASFQEKVVFYFESLAKLGLYNEMVSHGDPSNDSKVHVPMAHKSNDSKEERTMLSVNLSHAGKSCPRLFRVIKQKDGYIYQLLHEDGHYYMEEGFVTEEELMSLLPKTEGGWKVDLTWGPYQLL